jgi:dTDP-4-amino-4,6-dideoxygalactose transaminase
MKDGVSGEYSLAARSVGLSSIVLRSFFSRVSRATPHWNGATYGAILRSIASGSVVEGAALDALKSALIDKFSVADAALCSSGSMALELALRACGIHSGDEVVIPTFCCSAVVPPILALGATPVLADIGEELNLTVDTVAAAITQKTRAVVVPHLFGNPADIGGIAAFAQKKNIRVIDDAAQALGATIDGRPAGSLGDAGIASFGKEKICFGLGGGVLFSNRSELIGETAGRLAPARRLPVWAQLAATQLQWRWRRWTLPVKTMLLRGRHAAPDAPPSSYGRTAMANLQAAVALSLVATLAENIAARRARVRAYQELLGSHDGVVLIPNRSGSAYLTQVVRILPKRRGQDIASAVVDALAAAGYEIQGSYVPIHLLGIFRECVWDCLPYSERVWPDLVELPCEPSVSLDDVERIAAIVKRVIASQ